MSYLKGDICTCILDYEYGIGSKARPVVFWDNWESSLSRPTVLIIPLTSQLHKQHYSPILLIKKSSFNNLEKDSILKLYQFACVSKNNLGAVIGKLTESEIQEAERLLQESFPSLY